MPKRAQDLINQYKERQQPIRNGQEFNFRPLSGKVSETLLFGISTLSQRLNLTSQNANIPGDIRDRLTNQHVALDNLATALLSDEPDVNAVQGALDTLEGLGDLLSEQIGNNRTIYDEMVSSDLMGTGSQAQLDANINAVSSDLLLGIDTDRLHNHKPMVHEVWENEAIRAGWTLSELNQHLKFLPNENVFYDIYEYATDDDNLNKTLTQADYGMNGLDARNRDNVHFGGQCSLDSAEARHKVASQKIDKFLDKQREVSRNFAQEQSRRSDERTKRYYGDLAYISNPDNGNYMQAAFNTPYVTSLMSMTRTLAKPNAASSAEQKMDLGVPLYEASYDLMHSAAEEVRVQYNRQRLEKQPGGWTQEKENTYLSELKAVHEQTIRNFDNFARFSGRTDGSIQKQFQENDLNQTAAKNLDHEKRYKDAVIGELRGEVRAINNGWASNELAVLGMVGAMEANLKVYGKFGKSQNADEIQAFQKDFAKLKEECFHTKPATAAAKMQIADKVKRFMDSHRQTELQREIMRPVTQMEGAFDKANSVITAAAEKEFRMAVNPEALKGEDPVAYLKDLQQKAERSGNFSVYAAEVADVFAGMNKLPQEKQTALNNYWSGLEGKEGIDNEFVWNFSRAMAQNQVKAGAALEQAKQEMANEIRDGRETVDDALGDVKHIPEAARMIAGQKLENSEMARQFENAKKMSAKMDRLFAGMMDNYGEYLEHAEKEYANDPTDGLTSQEKEVYLNRSKEAPESLQKYGVEQVKDPATGVYTVTQVPTKERVYNELKSISDAIGDGMNLRGNDYRSKLRELEHRSGGLLTRLETLQGNRPTGIYNDRGQFVDAQTKRPIKRSDANSGAFMNMVDALKKVNELKVGTNSPLEINQALGDLDKAAEAYQRKIDSQLFGGLSPNGRERVNLARELRQFARQQREQLNVYENSRQMNPNEKVGAQATKINAVMDNLQTAINRRKAIHDYNSFDEFIQKKAPHLKLEDQQENVPHRRRSNSFHRENGMVQNPPQHNPLQP